MYISLGDLGLFILFCLTMTAGVIFIILMLNVIHLVKRVNSIVEANSQNINKSLTELPEVINNVNDFSKNANECLENANLAVGVIKGAVTDTVSTVEDSAEGVLDFVRAFSDIVKTIQGVVGMFGKK
ncbi:MAG: hypothetical protein N2645_04665 [Clostridia bacterium]|nr:hypothetical protein [Clostridia bacterium]